MADAADGLAGASSALTRGDLLKRGGGSVRRRHVRRTAGQGPGVYGPLRFAHKQLSGELRIMTWSHFVPDYEKWLDNTYVKRWGEANDVEVKIDHINNALLVGTAATRSPQGADTTSSGSSPRRRRSRSRPSP